MSSGRMVPECLAEHICTLHPTLKRQIITLNAMGTHIADAIVAKKADYILPRNGNQGNLQKEA